MGTVALEVRLPQETVTSHVQQQQQHGDPCSPGLDTAMLYLQASFGDVLRGRRPLSKVATVGRHCSQQQHGIPRPKSFSGSTRPTSASEQHKNPRPFSATQAFGTPAGSTLLPQVSPSGAADGPLADMMALVESWDEFDVFMVRDLSNRPLELVSLSLLQRLRLIHTLDLPLDKLTSFIQALEGAYSNSNAYHNSMHASDVLQTLVCFLLLDAPVCQALEPLEQLGLLLAAIVHDTAHPGLTNDYQVRTQSEAAIQYSNSSVNERLHLARSFALLSQPQHNFIEHLSTEQQAQLRAAMTAIVLATDMSIHTALMREFEEAVQAHGSDLSAWLPAQRLLAMKVLVHAADISNILKPTHISTRWAELILSEMWLQGDREAAEGREMSPLCDRATTNIPKSQLGFLQYVVRPCFTSLAAILPHSAAIALAYGDSNQLHYEQVLEEGRNAFR